MKLVALGIVDAGVAPSFKRKEGFGTLTRNAPGDYSLTLDDSYAPTEIIAQPTLQELDLPGIVVGVNITGTQVTVIRVKFMGPGDVGVDCDFALSVLAFSP